MQLGGGSWEITSEHIYNYYKIETQTVVYLFACKWLMLLISLDSYAWSTISKHRIKRIHHSTFQSVGLIAIVTKNYKTIFFLIKKKSLLNQNQTGQAPLITDTPRESTRIGIQFLMVLVSSCQFFLTSYFSTLVYCFLVIQKLEGNII